MERIKKFYKTLKEIGIPAINRSFDNDNNPVPEECPYIIYYVDSTIPFAADNGTYYQIHDISIELYTDYKDLELEGRVLELLNNFNAIPTINYGFIEEEQMHVALFEFRI